MVHSQCGGKISNRKCEKCGKEWNKVKWLIAQDIEHDPPVKFDEKAYRKRIRRGEDIWK